jgi:lysozyme family protein
MRTELRLRRRELRAPSGKAWKDIIANPLILAIVGGFVTLMTTTLTNSINTSNTIAADAAKARQALQADLIKKFVESPSRETVRTNLNFLADVGLLPDYADPIRTYLRNNPNSAPTASPTGLQAVRTDDDAIDLVISFEGGYFDDPTNLSSSSKFGITLPQLKNYLGREVTKDELRDLPLTVAREVYRKLFLQSVSPISSIAVKATYLCMAVNLGSARALAITQTAIGKASGNPIPPDGVLGPLTIALVNSLDPDLLVENMACEWARYYWSLPNFERFRAGWLKRVRAYMPANPKGMCPDVLPPATGAAAQ